MALTQISTAGVKDDAVTAGKIPANAVGSSEIAANAVGSSELADNAVDTAAIAADAITNAKLANPCVQAENLFDSSVTNAKIQAGAVGATSIGTAAVTTVKIADDAVTNAKLADNAVQGAIIAGGGIGSGKLAADSVSNTNIIDGNVTSSELATNAVTTVKIADDAVTADKLADSAVGTSNIVDGTVTAAKLASGVQTTINNNADNRVITGSGTANTLNAETNVFIESNGRLGIGTSGPSYPLHVHSGSANSNAIFESGDTAVELEFKDTTGTAFLECRNDFRLKNSSGELVRIDSSGRVYMANSGLSATDVADDLVVGNLTGGHGITIQSQNNEGGFLCFGDTDTTGTGSRAGVIRYQHSDNSMRFATDGNNERMRILSGGGITFNGDTAAANALDDYEEGSWTPEISFGNTASGQSYNSRVARYTKIGNRCYVNCYIHFSNKGSSTGTARVGGLPFTTSSISGLYQHGSIWINSSNFGNTIPTGYTEGNSTTFRIERQRTDGAGVYTCDHSNFNNNTDLMLSLHYQVN